MRISTSLLYQRGVDSMAQQQATLSKTQTQLATGERLTSPADDPFASTRILALDEQSKTLDQYGRNADMAMTRLQLEESALTTVVNTLQRIRELAVQGATGSLDTSDRKAISSEVFQHMDGILQLSNSVDASGEYIFSGNKTTTMAYTHNGTGTFTYGGDQGQRLVQTGASSEVAIGDPGSSVFDGVPGAGGSNIMEIIYNFADAMSQGNVDSNALGDIDAALNQVSDRRSVIGARVNALESQMNANSGFSLAIEENRSALADLDYADAVSRFQQQLAGLQAAQQSFIQIQNLSLFNFL